MADGRGAWRYAGESRPSHGLPKGASPSWTPSGPLETTHTDGDGTEPLDRVSTWPAAMARPCTVSFRHGCPDTGGNIFILASTRDREGETWVKADGELLCGAGHGDPHMAELR
jgi:hypothetical protein